MQPVRFPASVRGIAGLSAIVFAAWFAVIPVPVGAQSASEAHAAYSQRGYDAAHEIALDGVIEELIRGHAHGMPSGTNLRVADSVGLTDVQIADVLMPETQNLLAPGTPVRIVGAYLTLGGKPVLLARLLTVHGRTIVVRNQSGVPVRERGSSSMQNPEAVPSLHGGAQ